MTQLALDLELIVVHCCFCDHTVAGAGPSDAHDAMEAHYRDRHSALIASIVRSIT